MNTLTPRQQQALACGLSAFDRACLARRRARRARFAGGVAAAAIGIGVFVLNLRQPTRLPEYVQILSSDAQVTAELELANACERIRRTENRVVVVECALPAVAGEGGSQPERERPAG